VDEHEDAESHQNVGEEEVAAASLREVEGASDENREECVDDESQEEVKDSTRVA
jgi:hypothetical protein